MDTSPSNEHAGYLLRSRFEILEKLKFLQKKRCLLTAKAKNASSSFVTAIVQVMPEKDYR
jgi:hypothetical protein